MENGVGMSYHVPITVFLSPILSEQEGKSKGIGRGSLHVIFCIALCFLVLIRFDGTSVGLIHGIPHSSSF